MDIGLLLLGLFFLAVRKMDWALTILVLLTTNFLGACGDVSETIVRHNVSDCGLILFAALLGYLFFLPPAKEREKIVPLKVSLILFIGFVVCSIFVDLTMNSDSSMLFVVKTSRHWLFLLGFFFFDKLPAEDVKKTIFYCFYLVTIISCVQLFSDLTGIAIFQEDFVYEQEMRRGVLPSPYALFYLVLLFTPFFRIPIWVKGVVAGLYLAVIVLSAVRSLFVAVAMLFLFQMLLSKKSAGMIIKYIALSIAAYFFFVYLMENNEILAIRFASLEDEFVDFAPQTGEHSGSFSFRIALFLERFEYVMDSAQYLLFGIGNIIEEAFVPVFYVGLGETQLNTGDIAWALLILRLGLLGIAFYLFFWWNMLVCCIKKSRFTEISIPFASYMLIQLLVLSCAGSRIATGRFFIFPCMIFFLCLKENGMNDEKNKIETNGETPS